MTFLLPRKSDFVLDSSLYLDLLDKEWPWDSWTPLFLLGLWPYSMPLTALVLSSLVLKWRQDGIMSFAVLPLTSLAAGVTTFTSQNFGAKQFKRIVAGLKQSCLVSITWSVIACALLYVASPFLAGLISSSDNAVIIDNASPSTFVSVLSLSYFRNALHL